MPQFPQNARIVSLIIGIIVGQMRLITWLTLSIQRGTSLPGAGSVAEGDGGSAASVMAGGRHAMDEERSTVRRMRRFTSSCSRDRTGT